MSSMLKIVCPKCQAKLKFDPARIAEEVTRCKCPGCGAVLRLKKSAARAGKEGRSFIRHEKKVAAGAPEAGAKTGDHGRSDSIAASGHQDPAGPKEGPPVEPGEDIEDETIKVANSRKSKRVKFKKKVLVNNQIMVEALDISEDGLFLHTGRSFEDGTIVEVGIPTQPGSFDLKVQAEVRHNHRGIGMGMQFVEVDAATGNRLKKLVNELDDAASRELEGRKKILLAGGSDTARNINKSKLVLDGFYVLQATTADEVFRILEEEPPDAMVVEWQETKFNCRGLLAKLAQDPANDKIIKVVLSALTDSQVQQEILGSGAHKYMAKMDTNPARLSMVLKQLIEERDGT